MKAVFTPFVVCLILCLIACLSGLIVVDRAHRVRSLHAQLQEIRVQQDTLLAERSRLLLERGALAAYQQVESDAEQRLAMRFPGQIESLH